MTRRPIILEGPDGAGKSRLAQDLGYVFRSRVIHTGGANTSEEDLVLRMLTIQSEAVRGAVIFDRVPQISDRIYKEALGVPQLLSEHILTSELVSLRPTIVYVRRINPEDMLGSILDVKKEHKPPEYLEQVKRNHPKIVELYDQRMRELGSILPVRQFDWRVNRLADLVTWIAKQEH